MKPQQALEQAVKTLNIYPDNLHALHTVGWAGYLEKDYEKAYNAFKVIEQKEVPLLELQYHWALSAWKANQPKEAWYHFRIAAGINPDSLALKVSMGLFMEEQEKIQQAIFFYNQALALAPENEPVHEFLLEKVSSLLPLYRRESLVKDSNNNKKINRQSKKFTKTNSESESSLITSTNLPQRENPFLKPVSATNDARTLQDDFLSQEEHHSMGLKFLESGMKKDAISEFNTVINLNRTNSNAISAHTHLKDAYALPEQSEKQRIDQLMETAEFYFRNAQLKFAIYIYQKVLLLVEKHPIARKNLAYLYLETARPIPALKILEPLCREHPEFQEAVILKGYALAKLRRFPEAAAALREATNLGRAKNFSNDYSEELLLQIKRYDKPIDIRNNSN
jgi:tetratricopeptide (TPR) repeat protein